MCVPRWALYLLFEKSSICFIWCSMKKQRSFLLINKSDYRGRKENMKTLSVSCAIFKRWWDVSINNRSPRGRSRAFVCGLSSPVVGLHSVGRLTSGWFCQVCLGTGDFLRPQGAIPQGFYPLRGGYCLAPEMPQKGECRWSRRYFWPCQTCVGYGPATRPTLKMALCHIRVLVGRINKY